MPPSLPKKQTGKKLPDAFQKRTDLQVDEDRGYIYLPEQTGRTKQEPNGGDFGGGDLSSSEDQQRLVPKEKQKTNRRKRKGRGSDPDSLESSTDMELSEDDEHRKGRNLRKEKHRQKVEKNRKGETRRYDLSDDDESDTDSDLEVIRLLKDLLTKAVDYRTHRVRNQDSEYTSEVTQKITKQYKQLGFQIGDSTLAGDDFIAIIDFLQRFKIACDQNGFSQGAAT